MVLRKMVVPETLVEIIKSFHSDMKAKVRLEDEEEEIEVTNGRHQGCTMVPSLFNLYAYAMAEIWMERVKDVYVGTKILYKLDQSLVCQSTCKASEMCIVKGEFANDVVLMAHSKEAAATALRTYVHGSVAGDFGLTVSVPKTKFLVVGGTVTDTDKLPLL